jgi:mono/diheme cytochrome c family protein
MFSRNSGIATLAAVLVPSGLAAVSAHTGGEVEQAAAELVERYLREGKEIFRFDTLGSEDFWGGQLRLHEAIMGESLGGSGAGVSPETALAVGLKVDAAAVPPEVAEGIQSGEVDLTDPASTLALLKADAVVGVKGFFGEDGETLTAVGITCALCHSTVDDSFAPGIGGRLDGWPNRDLDVGAIVALAPDLTAFTEMLQISEEEVKQAVEAWGPGRYDAELSLDGKAFRPDGETAATLIPAAFGLAGVNNHTWTGAWGGVTYWNAFVGNLQMHGKGTFFDPRLDDAEQYPVAARTQQGQKRDEEDLITAKLPALQFYQLSLPTPKPPEGAFDPAAAERGEALFNDKARCATCHVPPIFTEPGWNLHTADEIGIDDFQAQRSPDDRYRTEPLRALWETEKIHKGGYYHDGRFATLEVVVDHYDNHFALNLSDDEKRDLIEYLKSI